MSFLRKIFLLITLVIVPFAMADEVVMHSGKTFKGEVLMQNDEVVIIRDNEGRRFQVPRTEVANIIVTEVAEQVVVEEKKNDDSHGNCALRLELGGGGAFVPSMGNGGYGNVAIQIGTRRIGSKNIFLGGSVGYQLAAVKQVYNFLPIMVAVSIPLMEGKHTPEIGAALGYGFAIKKPVQGGVAANLDINWRYQYQPSAALLIGLQTRFQQAQVGYTETIENKEYTSKLGKNFVTLGLRIAFQF